MAPTATNETTPQQWREFADKLEWEGGITSLLDYGGPDIFPPEVRQDALDIDNALKSLRATLARHGIGDEI